jgi:repressor LexA
MPRLKNPEQLPLSPRQEQTLAAVRRLIDAKGFPPSMRELAIEIGVHPTRARQLATALQRKGLLARDARVARSIRLTPKASPAPKRGRRA